MADFTGKIIIVTGGASGMGFATADLLAQARANVVLADLNQQACHDAAEKPGGGRVIGVRADVSVEDDVKAMVATAVGAFGKLDGACNAAGVPQTEERQRIFEEHWNGSFRWVFETTFW